MVGIEGYEVSNMGRVRSLKYKHPQLMLTYDTRQGYEKVVLRCDGRNLGRTVHRMVLEAFVGPRPEGHVCEWKNGRIWDNKLKNLRWVARDKAKSRFRPDKKPTFTKLTDAQVLEIWNSDEPGVVLAERFDVSPTAVSRIRRGKTWVHVTGG